MGNCSGLFANCTDAEGEQAVRKIDQERMQQAMAMNKSQNQAGADLMKMNTFHAQALPEGNHYGMQGMPHQNEL